MTKFGIMLFAWMGMIGRFIPMYYLVRYGDVSPLVTELIRLKDKVSLLANHLQEIQQYMKLKNATLPQVNIRLEDTKQELIAVAQKPIPATDGIKQPFVSGLIVGCVLAVACYWGAGQFAIELTKEILETPEGAAAAVARAAAFAAASAQTVNPGEVISYIK